MTRHREVVRVAGQFARFKSADGPLPRSTPRSIEEACCIFRGRRDAGKPVEPGRLDSPCSCAPIAFVQILLKLP